MSHLFMVLRRLSFEILTARLILNAFLPILLSSDENIIHITTCEQFSPFGFIVSFPPSFPPSFPLRIK